MHRLRLWVRPDRYKEKSEMKKRKASSRCLPLFRFI